MRKAFTKFLSLALTAAMTVGLSAGAVSQEADAAYSQSKLDKNPIVTAKPYRGYLTFQTGTMYNFRNSLDEDDYGILGSDKAQELAGEEYDYANTFVWNKPTDTTMEEIQDPLHDDEKIQVPKNPEMTVTKANFTNPDITYYGTYTVSMDGFDPTLFQYDTGWNTLGVSTNIPKDAPVEFTDVSLSIDGQVVYTSPYGVMADAPNFKELLVINRYGYASGGYPTTQDPERRDGVPDCIEGNYPKQSISITFTLRKPPTTEDGFHVGIAYTSQDGEESTPFDITEMDEESLVDVKGDGEYEVSYQTQSEDDFDDVNILLLATDLKNDTFSDSFNITATKLKVNDTEYKLNTDEGNLMFRDGNVEEGCLIYNVRNPYNYKRRRSMIKEDWSDDDVYIYDENGDKIVCDNILDKNGEIAKVPVPAGAKVTVCFTVTGTGFQNPATGSAIIATARPTVKPTSAPITETDGFHVGMAYISQDREEYTQEYTPFDITEMDEESLVDVKGDGEYEVSYQTQSDEDFDDVMVLCLATDLKNGAFADSFNITATKLKVNDTEYKLNTDEGNLMFRDGNVEEGCLIYNVRNPYNYKRRRSMIKEDWSDDDVYIYDENGDKIVCDNILDKNGEIAKVPVPAGAKMTICFTVTGTGTAEVVPTKTPVQTPAPTKTPVQTLAPTNTPIQTQEPIQTPTKAPYQYPENVKDGFHVGMTYVSDGWNEMTSFQIDEMDSENLTEVNGDGEYEVSYQTQSEDDYDDVLILRLATDLKNGTFSDSFNITATKLKVNDTEYKLNTDEGNLIFADGNVEENCLIYNVRNPWNHKTYRSMIKEGESDDAYILDENGDKITCDNILDENGDIAEVPVPAGAMVTVCFTVTGTDPEEIVPTKAPTQTPMQSPTQSMDPSQGDTGNIGDVGNTGNTGSSGNTGTTGTTPSAEPSEKNDDESGLLSPELEVSSVKKVLSKKSFKLDVDTASDGDLHYSSSNKKVAVISSDGTIQMKGCGTTKITVKQDATDEYRSAVETATLTVLPPQVSLRKVVGTPKKRAIRVNWTKIAQTSGYEISVATDRQFKKNVVTQQQKNKTSASVSVKKSRQKYYIRVRAYIQIEGRKVYGKWSKIQTQKTA